PAIAELLLRRGAKIECESSPGVYLLENAGWNQSCKEDMVALLRRYGAKPKPYQPPRPGVIEQGVKLLKNPEPSSRLLAAITLASYAKDARAAVPALIDALNDKDEAVKDAAARSLKQIDPDAAKRAGID